MRKDQRQEGTGRAVEMTQPRGPNAWTLGNPLVYDPKLGEGLGKARGGAVFRSWRAAQAALVEGRNGTYLPREWFPDAGPVPGAMYALRVRPGQVGSETDEVGAATLLEPAPILGRVRVWRDQPWDDHFWAFLNFLRRRGDYVFAERQRDGRATLVVTTEEVRTG